MMNAHTIPVRAEDPFSEPDIHDAWDAEEATQPTPAERLARVQAFAAECDRAYEARAPQREREAIRKQAIADEQFAQLSRQFCKMAGIEEPKILRGRS